MRKIRRKRLKNKYLDLLLCLFLFLIANVLFIVLSIPGFIYELAVRLKNRDVSGLADYFYNAAASTDQSGNAYNVSLFNHTMIQYKNDKAHRFGQRDEVISSVLGKNYRTKTQTKFGFFVDRVLHLLDPYHTVRSIEKDEYDIFI